MPDELILRDKAREAIRSGKLPAKKPDRTFGGPSSGAVCALCGDAIPRQQAELEIEFDSYGVMPGSAHYHLHPRCFAAWEFERTKVEGTGQSHPEVAV
jgi:hypothetical protein